MRLTTPTKNMGRHKYDINRPAFGSTPPAQPTTGEGVLDVVKDIAKRVGPKAVSGLTRKFGRKSGEKIVGWALPTPVARAAGPKARAEAQPLRSQLRNETANDWGGKEVAGDRIREILEANSLERKKTSPSKRQDKGRLGRPAARAEGVGVSNKANEVISRLLADDDDD